MEQLLAHLVGDYVLQNRWMAAGKQKSLAIATVHGLVYTLPFILLTTSPVALGVIFSTHAIIDHYNLGGRLRWLVEQLDDRKHRLSWSEYQEAVQNNGIYFAMRVLTDNTVHLLINYYAITYL